MIISVVDKLSWLKPRPKANLSFQIDWKQGGDIFSLDQYYGQDTGLYPGTVFLNDLGNPVRNPLANGGGLILPGVINTGTADNPNYVKNNIRIELIVIRITKENKEAVPLISGTIITVKN